MARFCSMGFVTLFAKTARKRQVKLHNWGKFQNFCCFGCFKSTKYFALLSKLVQLLFEEGQSQIL